MATRLNRRLPLAALAAALALAAPTAANAQQVLRDSETEALFQELMAPLALAAGLPAKNVDVVLVNDPEINAFVIQGQRVYVNAGLIAAADNANQLQGVLAHELGHVVGGHAIRSGEGQKEATGIAILSTLLGAAIVAGGGGDAGVGVMMAGQRAALGSLLAFTRSEESSADQAGAAYLSKAGVSGKGSIAFFKKLQNQEYRLAIPQTDSYDRTHPLSRERIDALNAVYQVDPAWNAATPAATEARFQRVKAKLEGYLNPKQALVHYPVRDQGVPAHYARAYAYHRSHFPDAAAREVAALLAVAPDDPYFLELQGQTLLESGKPAEALAPLRRATQLVPDQTMIAVAFGHALMATEDRANHAEAKRIVKAAVARDNQDPFAWQVLGTIYEREGDMAHAALAGAEQQMLEGRLQRAYQSAKTAMAAFKPGSADYLRAQDIAMVAKTQLDKDRKKKKRDDD